MTKITLPKFTLPTFAKPTKQAKRAALIVALGVTGVLALLTSLLSVYTLTHRGQIYPHTYIGTYDFGNQTASQAQGRLDTIISQWPDRIAITINGQAIDSDISANNLELHYDTAATAQTLLAVGRSGSLRQDSSDLIRSLLAKTQRNARYSLNETKAKSALEDIAKKNGDQAQDATIKLNDDGSLGVAEAKDGLGVTTNQLQAVLAHSLTTLSPSLAVTAEVLHPKVTADQTPYALAQVKAILAKTPLDLTAAEAKTTVDTKKVFSWVTYSLEDASSVATPTPAPTDTPSPSPSNSTTWINLPVAHAQSPSQLLVARINPSAVKDFVADFAATINTEPQNAELAVTDGKVVVAKTHSDGQRIKLDDAIQAIVAALTGDATTAATINLPVETVAATIQENTITSLGIKELIGHAETNFKGSPANRIHNIITGANFLKGAIIPMGQEFSTVKTLGPIDESTGYLPELVIKDNHTTPDFGGGLCQVSTTLFRAVLNAGLKVTERQNHSYRVHYYEPPIGLDATIYLPKPDLKFMNDTPGYILVQNKVDGNNISFDLYGTKDGRSSTISDPIVSNLVDPPDPIYADTDTLPKGTTKQIEKAHQGATAVVTYTVTRDGKEINKQVFRSKYKAWAASYLVGTHEDSPPAT